MSGNVQPFPKRPKRARRRATLACPDYLQGDARAEWLRITGDATAARLLGPENRAVIEAYCATYARWRLAEAHVAEHGPIVPAPRTSVPMHNPMAAVAAKERDALLKLADALGLTPRSRGQVEPATSEDGDSWGGLLA